MAPTLVDVNDRQVLQGCYFVKMILTKTELETSVSPRIFLTRPCEGILKSRYCSFLQTKGENHPLKRLRQEGDATECDCAYREQVSNKSGGGWSVRDQGVCGRVVS